MSVIVVLVAFSILVALGFLLAFFWSVKDGQYDDPYSSSVRILFEDEKPATGNETPASPEPDPSETSSNPK
jgi:cbb3-type cytochrome oxidase maturation protein